MSVSHADLIPHHTISPCSYAMVLQRILQKHHQDLTLFTFGGRRLWLVMGLEFKAIPEGKHPQTISLTWKFQRLSSIWPSESARPATIRSLFSI